MTARMAIPQRNVNAGKHAVWVTGATTWDDYDTIADELLEFPRGTLVIQGDAEGADRLAQKAALEVGHFRVNVPFHTPLGRAGGPARNQVMGQMLSAFRQAGYTVAVLAFGGDRGTDGSVTIARKLRLPVKEIGR